MEQEHLYVAGDEPNPDCTPLPGEASSPATSKKNENRLKMRQNQTKPCHGVQVIKSDSTFHHAYLQRAEDAMRRQDWVCSLSLPFLSLPLLPLFAFCRWF